MTDIFKQESAGIFGITGGGVLYAWSKGAPLGVIYSITALGIVFIIMEKWRARHVPKKNGDPS